MKFDMKKIGYVFLVLVTIACTNDDTPERAIIVEPKDYTAENEADITAYLLENELVAQKSESGLHYIIENLGDGQQPDLNSNITVVYKAYFLNGTVFDETTEEGLTFDLDALILGWQEGIPYFNEGGNGVLLIPSKLAYGNRSNGRIPPGSVLVFDVKLVSVN